MLTVRNEVEPGLVEGENELPSTMFGPQDLVSYLFRVTDKLSFCDAVRGWGTQ
jgi:hypothetical protein